MTIPGRWPSALSLAMVGALVGNPALATADGPDRFAVRDVRADDTLALRAQPNAGARKVTALPPNIRGIENLGCVDGKTGRAPADTGPAGGALWCKVRIGSLVGWASARYLREDTEILTPYSVSGAPTCDFIAFGERSVLLWGGGDEGGGEGTDDPTSPTDGPAPPGRDGGGRDAMEAAGGSDGPVHQA